MEEPEVYDEPGRDPGENSGTVVFEAEIPPNSGPSDHTGTTFTLGALSEELINSADIGIPSKVYEVPVQEFVKPGPSNIVSKSQRGVFQTRRSVKDLIDDFVGNVLDEAQSSKDVMKEEGPYFYHIDPPYITDEILPKNLPDTFKRLPIITSVDDKSDLPMVKKRKLREFIGNDLSDEAFEALQSYCSPKNLLKGIELTMPTIAPSFMDSFDDVLATSQFNPATCELETVKKHERRAEIDKSYSYAKKFKYRGMRVTPLNAVDGADTAPQSPEDELRPGKEVLFYIRLYRPFNRKTEVQYDPMVIRHPVLSREVVAPGRQRLSALCDVIACANDFGLRVDVAHNPRPNTQLNSKDLFPSCFLFINNVFYSDTRPGRNDLSAPIREWAQRSGIGEFQVKSMQDYTLDQIVVRLGHPEVYMHQGNCEHLFTISSIRVLNVSDPLNARVYPSTTTTSRSQMLYCTTCAEYTCSWLVKGCDRVPFDPAYFCDTCFDLYLYKNGKKIGDFKAYRFACNDIAVGTS